MEVKVFENYHDLSKEAAQEIINQVKKDRNSVLGLATGSSPVGIYNELINDFNKNHTSYKDVITFNLDEYFGIKKNHRESYYYFMKNHLFNYIDINLEHTNIPNGVTNNIELECDAYNRKLKDYPIDIQLLGLGSNGHIGFNEPGTPFDSVTHQIKLDEKTRLDNARFFDSIDQVPTHAVTMGIKNILDSKKIILVATGIKKADAVYGMVKGPIDSKCPASSLQLHPNVMIFLDQEAASKL